MATIPNSQKTFSVNEGVNTVYGGSASMKALSQWYTMQDITDTVRPYKVYTALLTQNGGNDFQSISSGLLTIGVTYQIISEGANDDFTNVGAPNNNVGTYFVATGTTPNYFDGGELEYNTGAPVVTVLENTIGNIWFTYNGIGFYGVNSASAFNQKKTIVIASPKGYIESPADVYSFDVIWGNSSESFGISSYYNNEPADDAINYGAAAMIEIRVYN